MAAALRGLRTADRLFGALELAVEALDVPVPRELVAHLAPGDGEFGVIGFIGEDEAVLAVRLLEVAHPGATDFVLEAVRGLVREDVIAPLLVVEPEYADEAGIAGRHGALHLALCVATSAALLRALGTEVARAVPAVVGTALGAAVLLLADLPVPEAYGRAVLEKRRAEYAYPRWSSNNPVVRDHRFALAEGPVPDDVDFSANGLVAAVPGGLVFRTGLAEGRVPVSLRVSAEPPEHVDLTAWDEASRSAGSRKRVRRGSAAPRGRRRGRGSTGRWCRRPGGTRGRRTTRSRCGPRPPPGPRCASGPTGSGTGCAVSRSRRWWSRPSGSTGGSGPAPWRPRRR